ncbi:MAG: STAS domain-containing protein [Ignavibacteria bacterium]|nr:STAS domain-containing protein [Ignavibacteria bacterium]
MEIQEKKYQGAFLLTLIGDFLSEVDQSALQEKVRSIVAQGSKHVILDLDQVHYMNSCGLGSLIATFTTMRKAGGDLRLVRVNPNVLNLLMLTRLTKIFNLSETLPEALAGYQST